MPARFDVYALSVSWQKQRVVCDTDPVLEPGDEMILTHLIDCLHLAGDERGCPDITPIISDKG